MCCSPVQCAAARPHLAQNLCLHKRSLRKAQKAACVELRVAEQVVPSGLLAGRRFASLALRAARALQGQEFAAMKLSVVVLPRPVVRQQRKSGCGQLAERLVRSAPLIRSSYATKMVFRKIQVHELGE